MEHYVKKTITLLMDIIELSSIMIINKNRFEDLI